jgi:hypothetical protein
MRLQHFTTLYNHLVTRLGVSGTPGKGQLFNELAPLFLALSSCLYFACSGEVDNDLWWHLLTGLLLIKDATLPRVDTLSFTARGEPWINHEWLTDIVLGVLYQFGGTLPLFTLKVLLGTVLLLLFGLLLSPCRSFSRVHKLLWILLVASAARGVATRPQLITYLALALLYTLIAEQQIRGRRWLFLAPLFILWGNCHGGFLAGVGLIGGYGGWLLLWNERKEGLWSLASLSISLIMLGLLNPYGFSLYTYLVTELARPHNLTEWQSPLLDPIEHIPFLLVVILFIGTIWVSRTPRLWWQQIIAIGTLLMALQARRHVPVFSLCVAAPLAHQISVLLQRLLAVSTFRLSGISQLTLSLGFTGLALFQVAFSIQALSRGLYAVAADYPVDLPFQMLGKKVIAPLEWGGFLLWHTAPCGAVSLDGRFATVYPENVVEQNEQVLHAGRDWHQVLARWNPDTILVKRGEDGHLRDHPDLSLIAESSIWQLFAYHPGELRKRKTLKTLYPSETPYRDQLISFPEQHRWCSTVQ